MKGLFKILMISTLLASCTSEDPIEKAPESKETNLISVFTPNKFYLDGTIGNQKSSGHLFLTDKDGELVIDGELANNSLTELSKDYDMNGGLNATFLKKLVTQYSNGTEHTRIQLQTFTNVDPYKFIFEEHISREIPNEEAKILVSNTDGYLTDIINRDYTGSIGINNSEFEIELDRIPDNIYFSFRHENEDKRRYFLLENVEENFTKSFEFESLQIAEELITVSYPENDYLSIAASGAIESDPYNFFAPLSQVRADQGLNSFSHNFNPDLFQKFKVITNLHLGNKKYRTEERSNSLNETYSLPDLNLEILNNSPENYELSSSSNYDFYNVNFYYDNEVENYDIMWKFYGLSSSNIKLMIPQILNMLELHNATLNIRDFRVLGTSIIKIEGIETYKDFITSKIDPESQEGNQFSLYESLSK
jgi:hypothetical protein